MKLTNFKDDLHRRLQDPDFAQAYLQAALTDGGHGEWLVALKDVAIATDGGLKAVAEEANLGRESMYKSLAPDGNPRWSTVQSVVKALGYELVIQPRQSNQVASYVREDKASYNATGETPAKEPLKKRSRATK